jgi:hypothetical protein
MVYKYRTNFMAITLVESFKSLDKKECTKTFKSAENGKMENVAGLD